MKKILTVFICVFLLSLFTGCSISIDTPEQNNAGDSNLNTTVKTTVTKPTEEEKELPKVDNAELTASCENENLLLEFNFSNNKYQCYSDEPNNKIIIKNGKSTIAEAKIIQRQTDKEVTRVNDFFVESEENWECYRYNQKTTDNKTVYAFFIDRGDKDTKLVFEISGTDMNELEDIASNMNVDTWMHTTINFSS